MKIEVYKAAIGIIPPTLIAIGQLSGKLEGKTAGYFYLAIAATAIAIYAIHMYWKRGKVHKKSLLEHAIFSKSFSYVTRGIHQIKLDNKKKETIYYSIIKIFLNTIIDGFRDFLSIKESELNKGVDCDIDEIANLFESWLKSSSEQMKTIVIRLPDGRVLDGIPHRFTDAFWKLAGPRLDMIVARLRLLQNNELYPSGRYKLYSLCEIMDLGIDDFKIDLQLHLNSLNGHLDEWLKDNIKKEGEIKND